MRAIDTNVLVRLITRDDPTQADAAERVAAHGAWVSQLVLAETVWVLSAVYGFSRKRLSGTILALLQQRDLAIQDGDVVSLALEDFVQSKSAAFTDCLILHVARKSGHTPLATFDRGLAKLDGVELIG